MKKVLREPLLHFVLLGAAIFAVHGLTSKSGDGGDDRGRIVVTQGQVAAMNDSFLRTRQRAPTREELEGLIRDRVREEAYVREAVALGLDKDDLIIRRRLQQKMEFIFEGRTAPPVPSDADLQAHLQGHAATFAIEPRYSFRQVYLDPQRHGAHLSRDADRVRVALSRAGAKAGLADQGDPILLEREYDASARQIATTFGDRFASALGKLPVGEWQGPVESGYGVHLVFLVRRTEGGVPALESVREAVRREWTSAQRRDAAAAAYQALLRKYAVTVDMPSETAGTPGPVAAR